MVQSVLDNVLITREYYPEKTLAELYDPDKMPQDLCEAHAKLDDIVESCYPGYPFASDEARLECLFKLYEKMTAKKMIFFSRNRFNMRKLLYICTQKDYRNENRADIRGYCQGGLYRSNIAND